MSLPRVVAVAPGSPAFRAGLQPGDEVVSLAGRRPRDVIEWRLLTDEADVDMELRRGGLDFDIVVAKDDGEPLGAEVSSALFDKVRTCDNHCEFCFIYQLPPALRQSLYLKDDDYRLSFLYGNFTTLTRFTEMDLERVVTERLSPLNVSIHATDPDLRARMLRNKRGATSLRWLRALLDHGIEVHGQVVVCPGLNDVIAGLVRTLTYHYRVRSRDAASNEGISRFTLSSSPPKRSAWRERWPKRRLTPSPPQRPFSEDKSALKRSRNRSRSSAGSTRLRSREKPFSFSLSSTGQ